MKMNSGRQPGLTLIELVVVVVIIAVLMAIALPVYFSARESGRRVACIANLKQFVMALGQYLEDAGGQIRLPGPGEPANWGWMDGMLPYTGHPDIFRCPSDGRARRDDPANRCSYGFNLALFGTPLLAHPGSTIVAFDSSTNSGGIRVGEREPSDGLAPDPCTWFDDPDNYPDFSRRHHGGANYFFADGHIKWHTPPQIAPSTQPNDGTRPSFRPG